MRLDHSFTVALPVAGVWTGLLDIEQVATCLPGAAITSVDSDLYSGTVKVKLGPVALTYRGQAEVVEKDEAAHRAVIVAQGRDARGNGTASARVTAVLSEADGMTTVDVHTELDITGKPAQFGRGVIVDVSDRLFAQFTESLAEQLRAQGAPPTHGVAPATHVSAPAAAPVSAAALLGPALAKRLAPTLAALVLVVTAMRILTRPMRRRPLVSEGRRAPG